MRVMVVGAGIIGLFTAYYLAQRNHEVTIVDKDPTRKCSSIASAGMIVPSFSFPPPIRPMAVIPTFFGRQGPVRIPISSLLRNSGWLAAYLHQDLEKNVQAVRELASRSLKLYEEFLTKESPQVNLRRGVLCLYRNAAAAADHAHTLNKKMIGGRELEELGYLDFGGGVLLDDEFALDPGKLVAFLYDRIRELGVKLLTGTARILRDTSSVAAISVNNQPYYGDAFILSAGAETRILCQVVGYDPPIVPARGLAAVFSTDNYETIGYPALLEDYGVALVPHDSGRVRVTSFFDLEGFNPIFPDKRRQWLENVLRVHVRGWERFKFIHEAVGYRPCTPNHLPIIGNVPSFENLLIASGHCRLGITLAPATGVMIADMLDGIPIQSTEGTFAP